MGTKIRPTISKKNKYWISKHRHYELKHFCLQYPEWKKLYLSIDGMAKSGNGSNQNRAFSNPTEVTAIRKEELSRKMRMVEQACIAADSELYLYLLEGVTKEATYEYLSSILGMPCCRDTYYDRYRKFFWILDQIRD